MILDKNLDVIWFSSERANNAYSSTSISMAKELSKTNRVFFIDNPFTHFMLVKELFTNPLSPYRKQYNFVDENSSRFLVKVPPYVFSINWLPTGELYRQMLMFNNNIIFEFINKLIEEYKIKSYVFVNVFNPFYCRVDYLKRAPVISIYYSVDEISLSPYMSKHGPVFENEIPDWYDILLSTSTALHRKFTVKTSKARYLPNGADTGLFKIRPQEVPEEFIKLKKSVVIFVGHIDWRMDTELMADVINSCPDLIFMFVGPVSLGPKVFQQLKGYANVIFTGSKHINDLPGYLYSSSCAIIPFKRNDLTKNIYPLKINEYLAAGIPVVATSFSEDIYQFSDVIVLADTPLEFQKMIRTSILTNTEERKSLRIQKADQNGWSDRARKFWEFVGEACEIKSSAWR